MAAPGDSSWDDKTGRRPPSDDDDAPTRTQQKARPPAASHADPSEEVTGRITPPITTHPDLTDHPDADLMATQVGHVPEAMMRHTLPQGAPAEDDADATRVGHVPEAMTHLATPQGAPADDDADATRVGHVLSGPAAAMHDAETRVAPSPGAAPAASPAQTPRRTANDNLPPELQMPSFDFNLPSLPDVAAAKAAGTLQPLPEHLQLPTFPDLDDRPGPASRESTPAPAPPPVPKKAAPPPLPPPVEAPAVPAAPMLDLRLPEIAPRTTQRNLTLVAGATTPRALKKTTLWPFILAGVLAVVALSAFVLRESIIAWLAPKKVVHAPVPRPLTPHERAEASLGEGARAYTAKDYPAAIKHFEAALTDDPRLVEAHRSLGIVYATMHDQARAVRHYQDYLALSPHAADAAEVLKIIEDYKRVQAKAAAPEASCPPNQAAKGQPQRASRPTLGAVDTLLGAPLGLQGVNRPGPCFEQSNFLHFWAHPWPCPYPPIRPSTPRRANGCCA